ncbi:MAG TPA: acyl-CoA dehydrogenase family protein [Chloroflexota bacterium]|nr:acyl-CoA dehydrogenase family protein [Chloroflexota bacterium]
MSEEQEMIRDAVREFAASEVAPRAEEIDRSDEFPRDLVEKAAELDFLGIVIPETYGGAGLDHVCFALFVEEIAARSGSLAVILDVHTSVGSEPILFAGTEEQKRRFLPDMAAGRKLGAFALTEPDSGSDAASLKTSAVRDGNGWRLNGTKTFITNMGVADLYIVLARTNQEQRGARGVTAFIVENGADGLEFGRPMEKMGLHGSPTGEVILHDVFVPAENLLGDEGGGFKIAMRALDSGRIGISAQAIGLARGAMEVASGYVKERRQFGKAIAEQQAIQFMIADRFTEIEAARIMTLRAAAECDRGQAFTRLASMAKLFSTDMAMRATVDAVQLLGGYGYIKEFPVERYFRDAKATQIYEGTNQIQRIVIARDLLAG